MRRQKTHLAPAALANGTNGTTGDSINKLEVQPWKRCGVERVDRLTPRADK